MNPQVSSPCSSERLQKKPSSPTRSWRTLTFRSNQVELLHLSVSLTYLLIFHSHHLITFIRSENSLEPHLQNASSSVLVWERNIFVYVSYGISYFLSFFFFCGFLHLFIILIFSSFWSPSKHLHTLDARQ